MTGWGNFFKFDKVDAPVCVRNPTVSATFAKSDRKVLPSVDWQAGNKRAESTAPLWYLMIDSRHITPEDGISRYTNVFRIKRSDFILPLYL
ncbi:hypothetical protein M090_2618 [Parabacteroides distasonis str. 3776 Po2 i]|nr:hypothetical protein M090_2618 [Parabacteroides distasonis str. 3776 Po2 i]